MIRFNCPVPNGITTTYQYDGLDRLTRLRDATAIATIADNQYSYNTASQISQIADLGGAHNYGYDPVDRLTSATYPGTTAESFGYDSVGNRTASHLSASYGYQPFNKLTSTTTSTYAYDNNGNLLSKTVGARAQHCTRGISRTGSNRSRYRTETLSATSTTRSDGEFRERPVCPLRSR